MSGKCILVAEDDERTGKSIRGILGDEGYEVRVYTRGEDLVKNYLQNPDSVGLVITDMEMDGGMSGIDVVEKLRNLGYGRKIIGMSGDPAESDFIQAGADGFLPKPFSLDEIIEMVKKSYQDGSSSV